MRCRLRSSMKLLSIRKFLKPKHCERPLATATFRYARSFATVKFMTIALTSQSSTLPPPVPLLAKQSFGPRAPLGKEIPNYRDKVGTRMPGPVTRKPGCRDLLRCSRVVFEEDPADDHPRGARSDRRRTREPLQMRRHGGDRGHAQR